MAPRRCGSVMQEFHYPLPSGSEAVYCRSSTAHCPEAVRQYVAGVALPIAPRQWGSVSQEFHCQPRPRQWGTVSQAMNSP